MRPGGERRGAKPYGLIERTLDQKRAGSRYEVETEAAHCKILSRIP
jgi:hypothetical protein